MATDGPHTPPPSASGAAAPGSDTRAPLTGDWPVQAADLVVDVVSTVRDRTLGPIMLVARALVYGILVTVLALTATILLLIAVVRFVDWLVPGEVWSAYLVLGTVFTIGGLVMWSQRRPRQS
jgi:hypothetical protein